MEGQQLSSTRVGTARGEQSTLLTSTAEQRGRMAADWAASQRRRQRGEPEQETEPEATSITLKRRAEELREQLEWTKPQRPLLDGGQGKHISGASKSQKRRRRKRLLRAAAEEDGKLPLAGVTSVPSGDELSPVPSRAEGSGPNQPTTQRPQVPVTNGRPNQPAAQRCQQTAEQRPQVPRPQVPSINGGSNQLAAQRPNQPPDQRPQVPRPHVPNNELKNGSTRKVIEPMRPVPTGQ